MGVQIIIRAADMQAAGWTRVSSEEETYEWDEDTQCEVPTYYTVTYWEKGDASLRSYSETDFMWDSNTWGDNRELQRSLGLLELPHEFV